METKSLAPEKQNLIVNKVADFFRLTGSNEWALSAQGEEWVISCRLLIACRIPFFPSQYDLDYAFVFGCRGSPRDHAIEWNQILDQLVHHVIPEVYDELGVPIDSFGAGAFGAG